MSLTYSLISHLIVEFPMLYDFCLKTPNVFAMLRGNSKHHKNLLFFYWATVFFIVTSTHWSLYRLPRARAIAYECVRECHLLKLCNKQPFEQNSWIVVLRNQIYVHPIHITAFCLCEDSYGEGFHFILIGPCYCWWDCFSPHCFRPWTWMAWGHLRIPT